MKGRFSSDLFTLDHGNLYVYAKALPAERIQLMTMVVHAWIAGAQAEL